MRATHLAGAAIVVAAAVAAQSAMTAANTVPNTIAGYGEGSITGATVSSIAYTALSTDNTKLSQIVFTSTTDVTGKTATLTLKNGATQVGTSPYSCSLGSFTTTMTITCATADNPLFASFNTVGLTVA